MLKQAKQIRKWFGLILMVIEDSIENIQLHLLKATISSKKL